MKSESLSIWTVYDSPLDFPGLYVARRSEVNAGGVIPTGDVVTNHMLSAVRLAMLDRGLYRMDRDKNDEPHIIECWL